MTLVDTDLGFSFDQSIDRNGDDMFSWQIGGFYQWTDNLTTGLAVVVTDGYEDSSRRVEIEGTGANFIVQHKGYGALEGLDTLLILNKAIEYRQGSALGDELDYYDIKLSFTYPLSIF
ncbi:glucuronide transport facilitator UidC [Vibrio ishigakensis]|uniref:Glucuronide transport facilitator UidC n=1 Tax=Vibrio ishigakensis TaxID=1481914 RepID=A0A0B8Q4M0_9VIBR|nr:glucuronide transport facilitator UidC [Vibrio ishigakensis]